MSRPRAPAWLLVLPLLLCASPARCFRNYVHSKISKRALTGLRGPDGNPKFDPLAVEDIAHVSDQVDVEVYLHLKPHLSAAHFDDNRLTEGLAFIEDQFQAVADPKRTKSIHQAQVRFGWVLHAVQDFYSHSDYVEAWLASQNKGVKKFENMSADPSRIPAWNHERKAFGRDLVTGSYPDPIEGIPTHDELNKDTAESDRGGKTFQDEREDDDAGPTLTGLMRMRKGSDEDKPTLFDAAFNAAVKESADVVPRFEQAVRLNPLFKDKNPISNHDRDHSDNPDYP